MDKIFDLKKLIINTLDSNKALDIVSINLENKSSMADHLIIASGTSSRHMQALSEIVLEKFKSNGITNCKIEGEIKYFNDNPKVGGMVADDNMIILNPNPDKDINMDAVTKNEFGRVLINTGKFKVPNFKLTDTQQKEFSKYGTNKNIQDTIITRIVSGDPSAKDFTPEQKAIADKLELVIQQQVQ